MRAGLPVFATASLCLTALLPIAPALGQAIKWDMAETFPPNNVVAQASGDFARLVKEKTNGNIEITVHYSGSLGLAERDFLLTVEQGVVPISSTIIDKILATMPVAAVQYQPFMIDGLKEARVMANVIRPYIEAQLAKQNQVYLFESYGTPVGIWSKKPVQDLATLKSLKLRSNNPNSTKTFQNAGASPTFMAWGDVPPALSTGVIDSVITTCESGISARFSEQLKHYTRLNLEIGTFLVHMHKPTLDKLPPDLKSAVLEAAAEAGKRAYDRALSRLDENTKTLKAAGVTIHDTVPKEFRDHLVKSGSFLLDDWKKKVGAETANKILSAYEEQRKKLN
jgi:TRAP-type C4-dicarboxylate transport system substrate-binding protein